MSGPAAHRPWLSAALITLAAGLSYFTAIGWWHSHPVRGWEFALNEFTLDDYAQVVRNPHVQSPWPPWHVFTLDLWAGVGGAYDWDDFNVTTGAYRPLYLLSCAAQIGLHGQEPLPLHLGNVLLHLAVCLLIHPMLLRLGCAPATSLITALLFAVIPIHAEDVASIVGRSELLAALGMAAAVYTWLGDGTPPSTARAAGAAAWFAAALFSKEGAIVTPALLLLANWARGDRVRQIIPLFGRWSLCLIPAAVYFGLRWWIFGSPVWAATPYLLDNALVDATGLQRFAAAPVLLYHYLRLTYLPLILSSDYSYRAFPILPPPLGPQLVMAGAAVAFTAALAALPSQRRALAAGAAALGLTMVLIINWPMLSLIMFAERLFYTPSLFALLPLGALLAAIHRWQRAVGLGLILGLLLVYGLRTAFRNRDWRNNFALAEKTVLAVPGSARAQAAWGSQMLAVADGAKANGHLEEAAQAYEIAAQALDRAIQIYPEYHACHALLASILAERGEWQRAADMLEFAVPHIPLTPALVDLQERIREHVD